MMLAVPSNRKFGSEHKRELDLRSRLLLASKPIGFHIYRSVVMEWDGDALGFSIRLNRRCPDSTAYR